jgi:hypothetical protein
MLGMVPSLSSNLEGSHLMSYVITGARFGGHTSFTAGAPMTDLDLRRVAPSIFAIEAHASRSDKFAYIPTYEVLRRLRDEGFVPVRAIQGKSRIEGKAEYTKHMVRFRHPDYAGRAALGGASPEVVLLNAHDGTSSYRVMSGVFRSICTNSMIVMEDGATDIRISHKGNIVDQVIEGSFTVIEESRLTLEKAEAWTDVKLLTEERNIMAEAAHVLRFGDAEGNTETAIKPAQLLAPRRRDDQGDNLWLTHNVIQENVIRGGLHAWGRDANNRPRRVTTREVKNIDGDVKLNRALWLLSQKMAELKKAA